KMARILVLANNDSGLYKFRKELLEELVKDNQVYISLPYGEYVPKLQEIGCKFIDTRISRRGTNPVTDVKLLLKYKRIIKTVHPDLVLTYTIKPNVYGGLACRMSGVPYITNITGLGTALENRGLLQKITITLYRLGLKKVRCVFFQNESNRNVFLKNNITNSKTRLIPGSGVNLEQHIFEEYPEDDQKINFLFIGRIMKEKGTGELLQAAKIVKEKYPNVHFELIGFPEEDYHQQLDELTKLGIIHYYGHQDDVHSFIKKSHATILPSYHEGTANVLLESASSGRPVLASRVPGCIETFTEDVSGLGFDVKSVDSLVDSILKFINLPYEQKKQMGIAGRRKMENEFDRNIVIDAYVDEIKKTIS
ncbi:MAG: glycosyltransferase family 4 protein, partial [Bacillota bacterium]|nr:glycosyltransferase family 4 protein [Bacillota bacterium]